MLVVLGNACHDITYRVDHLPAAGETVNAREVSFDLGGKGLNQAIAARRAGAQVRFHAPVGNDAVADAVRSLLAEEGIAPDGLMARSGSTDASTILIDGKGENTIVTNAAFAEGVTARDVERLLALDANDGLLMQGNLPDETTQTAATLARRAGAKVILNPAPFKASFASLVDLIDVVILNAIEVTQWTGHPDPKVAIEKLGVPLAIVTLGASGCLLHEKNQSAVSLSAQLVEVADTTGAGDTFVGVFTAEWLATGNAVQAARLALRAASGAVGRRGATSAIPSRDVISRLRIAMLEESRA